MATDKSYLHQLDAKNRMRLPAKIREEIGDDFYITIGISGCLNVYTKQQMKDVTDFCDSVDPFNEAQMTPARAIKFYMFHPEEDAQGRFILPDKLRAYGKIVKNLIVYRGPACVEIWAEEVFNAKFAPENIDFSALSMISDKFKKNA